MFRSALDLPSLRRKLGKGFTLLELLIVIAVIAILVIVVLLILNPAELFKQARDGNRVSDMDTLNKALLLASFEGVSMGTANTTYVSIPDPAATSTLGDQCQGLGLPALPSGNSYHCANTSYYKKTDGTGWLGINLTSISSGSPIGSLPADPTNQSSTALYYTYTTDGKNYEITCILESQKYQSLAQTDGGVYNDLYEKGTSLNLILDDFATVGQQVKFKQVSSVSNGATASLSNTTQGSLLFASVLSTNNDVTSIIDGYNTWNFIGEDTSSNDLFFFWTTNTASGNLTFTENGDGTVRFWVAEFTDQNPSNPIAVWEPSGLVTTPTLGQVSESWTHLTSIVSLWENPPSTGSGSNFDNGSGTIVLYGGNGAVFLAYDNALNGPGNYTSTWTQTISSGNGGMVLVKAAKSASTP